MTQRAARPLATRSAKTVAGWGLLAGCVLAACTTDMVDPDPRVGEVLVGAGDIAECALQSDEATADLLDGIPGTVFTAGDNAYDDGTAQEFLDCYEPSWGRHKARTRPSAGNHDYNTPDAVGYYEYFGSAAGDPAEGYYSYDLGEWHVVVLNSNIARDPGSPQMEWVINDLANSSAECTVAYWHHPRFTSGFHRNDESVAPMWEALYAAGAEIVINGHDHHYERFAPQDPAGQPDASLGIQEFIVGTGGTELFPAIFLAPNSEVRNAGTHGVLQLTLYPGAYDWEFVPVAGQSFTDMGSGVCH